MSWARIFNPLATQTIYPYIPVEAVCEFFDAHGGIDLEKSLSATE